MSEHTPGPWTAHTYNSYMGTLISHGDISKGQTVANAFAQKDAAEGKANARLIAAAPELLAALTNLLSLAKENIADAQDWHDIQYAERILAKAGSATQTAIGEDR